MARRYASKVLWTLVLLGTLGLAVMASAGDAPSREIVLETRDMAFYLPGNPVPNPTIVVTPGETVRIILVNRDRGMKHDVTIDSLGLQSQLLSGDGSSTDLVFRVPKRRGSFEYTCSLHQQMMRGLLVIGS